MRSTFKLLFYINRNKVKSDGTIEVHPKYWTD